ncbi:MAG: hypothetical protein MZV64_28895 [Ignavibacteriales bacterium]|nr:hypothetical protein [Ignavibacteriales bacterium]
MHGRALRRAGHHPRRLLGAHPDGRPRDQPALTTTLIEAFDELTGCPVIINTSFNVRGEPIVCTPEDAYRCFMRTNIDYLVLENFFLDKRDMEALQGDSDWKKVPARLMKKSTVPRKTSAFSWCC